MTKLPYTQQWYGSMSLEISLTNIKRNNHHGVNTKRSSLLHYDSKLWSINFVLNNIKIKSTTIFESYKMVCTCTFNYVTMSIPNPKRNRCARPQLRTLIDINIKGYHHRWILPLFGWQMLMFVPSNDYSQEYLWLDIVYLADSWPIWATIPMDT